MYNKIVNLKFLYFFDCLVPNYFVNIQVVVVHTFVRYFQSQLSRMQCFTNVALKKRESTTITLSWRKRNNWEAVNDRKFANKLFSIIKVRRKVFWKVRPNTVSFQKKSYEKHCLSIEKSLQQRLLHKTVFCLFLFIVIIKI